MWSVAAAIPAVAAGVAATRRGRQAHGWPLAGGVTVVGSMAALWAQDRVPGTSLVVGVIMLGFAGLVPLPWRVPALAPGGLVVAAAIPSSLPPWATATVVVGTMVAGVTAPLVDSRHRPGVGATLLAGTAVGAWACVPDVEQAGVVAGAAVASALLALLVGLRLGTVGAPAVVGLLLWAAATGATGRPAALIGATAGLGVLIVGMAALPVYPTRGGGVLVVAGQAALVTVTGRVAGLQPSPVTAIWISSTAVLVVTAALRLGATAGSSRGGNDEGWA